ncbi:MAG: glycerol-3-phosphate dehydrogenase [Pseudomonadota bacterium]
MEPVDLLVVGGGINGAGVARDAAGRGLSVILAEKDDLAEGTSSRSGKYIHGGLRYLEYYEFRLVREALIEREVVLAAAPHLASPLRLVLPHSPEQRPRWLIRLGLFLYDTLGGRKRIPATEALDLRRAAEGAPLRAAFAKGFAYYDVWCDDARLVVLNAVDAAARGAKILTRTACVSARREQGLWRVVLRDSRTGQERTVTARAIFNTAGPWVEQVIGQVAGLNARHHVRLVKGSHIILKRWWQGDHGYVLQNTDRRIIFVNPYLDDLALVGTTDIPFEGRPEDVACTGEEIGYLLGILNRYFSQTLGPEDVLSTYAGVRPLFDDDSAKSASAVTRDYTFELDRGDGRAPLLSAFGGKLTTYRKLAEHGLERLAPHLPGMAAAWTSATPLPGGDMPGADFAGFAQSFAAARPWLPPALAARLAEAYGTLAEDMLAGARDLGALGQHFGAGLYEAEVRWLMQREWAQSAEDILQRRTKLGLVMRPAEVAALADWLALEQAA